MPSGGCQSLRWPTGLSLERLAHLLRARYTRAMSAPDLNTQTIPPSAEYAAVARSLLTILDQSPMTNAHVLGGADDELLGMIWLTWLGRADGLSKYAGNTRVSELILRSAVATIVGVGIGWFIAGFPVALVGLGLTAIVSWWWWARRRAWHRSTIVHILWGALLASEFKQRHDGSSSELARSLVEKVQNNVHRFTAHYESWVGRPLARRIG